MSDRYGVSSVLVAGVRPVVLISALAPCTDYTCRDNKLHGYLGSRHGRNRTS